METTDEDREQWRPEQLEILTLLAGLARRSEEPVILIRIREVLSWHCRYSQSDEVRAKADAIVSSIPGSFELRLTQELLDPFHRDDWQPNEESGDNGYRLRSENIGQMQRALVVEFIGHSEHVGKAYEILAERIQTIVAAGVQFNPQVILGVLGDCAPECAAGLCDIIIDNPDGPLAPYLQPFLASVRKWSVERARDIGQRALRGGSPLFCRGLALSYQSRAWANDGTPEDIEVIRELINLEDIDVRRLAIGALAALAEAHPRVAIDLAKGVAVGNHVILAKNLCELFSNGWGVPFRELTSDDLKVLLSKLEDVQEIDDYSINSFLVKASEQDARAVVGLMLTRIRKKDNGGSRSRPLPILGFRNQLTGLAEDPDQEIILREIRDTLLEPGSSVAYWIPQLFREVSLGFESAPSLKVLNEWINSGNAGRIESAARLVAEAQPDFVFQKVEFTVNLLGARS